MAGRISGHFFVPYPSFQIGPGLQPESTNSAPVCIELTHGFCRNAGWSDDVAGQWMQAQASAYDFLFLLLFLSSAFSLICHLCRAGYPGT